MIDPKLADIGFYTLSDERARSASASSHLQRCEILITDRCNFKCPYCRGVAPSIRGELPTDEVLSILSLFAQHGLQNVRFTGGEPTLHPGIHEIVNYSRRLGIKRIAISTNGSMPLDVYKTLIDNGVNDLSISLDGSCCSVGEIMSGGVTGAWDKVVANISDLSKLTYVTVGMVFTEENVTDCVAAVKFAASLGVSDIRVIPSAQFNQALSRLTSLPTVILSKYPILRYRINNLRINRQMRGLHPVDTTRCPLVLDDMAVAGKYHFPCVIYLREQGYPIGVLNQDVRARRNDWFLNHNTHRDPICMANCLDVCRDYNNRWEIYHNGTTHL